MGFIYKIVNTDNDKVYIGQTRRDLDTRWNAHKHAIKSGRGCPLLARAFNSHGAEKFSMEMVEECEDNKLCEREVFYIQHFNSLAPHGYNADAGGKTGGTFKGHKHSQETIDRWRETVKEKYQSEEYRKMRSEIAKAYYANPENRAKHSAKMKEVAHSEEHGHKFKGRFNNETNKYEKISDEVKEKIRASINKYYSENEWSADKQRHSDIMKKINGRKVGRFNNEGDQIESYDTIKDATAFHSFKTSAIWTYINKKRKDNDGCSWKYLDEGSETANRQMSRNLDKEKHRAALIKKLGKAVDQYSLAGNFIASFNSIVEASEATNVSNSMIGNVARGKYKTGGGFVWKFAEDQGLKDVSQ
jgi:group I intron endonuclease